VEPCHGQLARRGWGRWLSQACGSEGDDAFNTRIEPDNTDAAEPLFRRDADQRKSASREGMGGIGHCDRVGRECRDWERGSLM